MKSVNVAVFNKFVGLLTYLTKTTEDFERVADEVEDCNLKTAFNGLSAESSQYMSELATQLRSLGFNYETSVKVSTFEIQNETELSPTQGDEVFRLCTKSENTITKAYNEILTECFEVPRLKAVMTYQLNALAFSFMKIKLLNVTRFSS